MASMTSVTAMKSRRGVNQIKRTTRGGSSAKVSFGGIRVPNNRAAVSCRPNPVRSPAGSVCRM